ncbi:hypothetical protein JCM11641_000357 [Rhodosporidiobolus odoratus]
MAVTVSDDCLALFTALRRACKGQPGLEKAVKELEGVVAGIERQATRSKASAYLRDVASSSSPVQALLLAQPEDTPGVLVKILEGSLQGLRGVFNKRTGKNDAEARQEEKRGWEDVVAEVEKVLSTFLEDEDLRQQSLSSQATLILFIPQVFDLFSACSSRHPGNKTRLTNLTFLGPHALATTLSTASDSELTSEALELAFRLTEHVAKTAKDKGVKERWIGHVWPEKEFGKETKKLRSMFAGLRVAQYHEDSPALLEALSSREVTKYQVFTALQLTYADHHFMPADVPKPSAFSHFDGPVAFNRSTFTAATARYELDENGVEEEDAVEETFEFGWEEVERVELEEGKGANLSHPSSPSITPSRSRPSSRPPTKPPAPASSSTPTTKPISPWLVLDPAPLPAKQEARKQKDNGQVEKANEETRRLPTPATKIVKPQHGIEHASNNRAATAKEEDGRSAAEAGTKKRPALFLSVDQEPPPKKRVTRVAAATSPSEKDGNADATEEEAEEDDDLRSLSRSLSESLAKLSKGKVKKVIEGLLSASISAEDWREGGSEGGGMNESASEEAEVVNEVEGCSRGMEIDSPPLAATTSRSPPKHDMLATNQEPSLHFRFSGPDRSTYTDAATDVGRVAAPDVHFDLAMHSRNENKGQAGNAEGREAGGPEAGVHAKQKVKERQKDIGEPTEQERAVREVLGQLSSVLLDTFATRLSHSSQFLSQTQATFSFHLLRSVAPFKETSQKISAAARGSLSGRFSRAEGAFLPLLKKVGKDSQKSLSRVVKLHEAL